MNEYATLVLLSPVALTPSTWDNIPFPEFPQFRYAYPGLGMRPPEERWTLDTLADHVVERIAGPLHLVGVSMGAMLAQHISVRHPERVLSMVIMGAGATTPTEIMLGRASEVDEVGMVPLIDATLTRWFSRGRLADPQNIGVERARAAMLQADGPSVAQAWRAMAGHDLRHQLGSLGLPVTVLAAEDDKATPVAVMEEIAGLIPGAHLVRERGPHMLHLEARERFGELVNDHFDRMRGRQ